MKIIIPMAGKSRRFQVAGYRDPKPFILIDGVPMIERVLSMFSDRDEFILICNEDHLAVDAYAATLNSLAYNVTIVPIPAHTQGPVYSCLQIPESMISDHEPVIVSYCDFFMEWSYSRFLDCAGMSQGAIPVFRGFQAASFGQTQYCYVQHHGQYQSQGSPGLPQNPLANLEQRSPYFPLHRNPDDALDGGLIMSRLREKQSFTDNRLNEFTSSGVYYLDRWDLFKHYARQVMTEKLSVGSEYYVSLLFNPMVQDGYLVRLFEIPTFICWGTPEDLHQYLFWSRYFKSQARDRS